MWELDHRRGSSKEAKNRLDKYGKNELPKKETIQNDFLTYLELIQKQIMAYLRQK